MMNRKVQTQRGFWNSVAVLIAWIGISQGAYSIIQGTVELFAILGLFLGALAVILILLPAVIEMLSSIEVETWRLTLSMAVILVFTLSSAVAGPSIGQISAVDNAFDTIQRVGTLFLAAIVIWQTVRSIRQSAVDPE